MPELNKELHLFILFFQDSQTLFSVPTSINYQRNCYMHSTSRGREKSKFLNRYISTPNRIG